MEQTHPQNTNDSAEFSVISVTDSANGAGRPTKYNEQTVATLREALSRGSTIKAACKAAGIGVQTLSDWKKEHPELQAILEAAQEEMRQKALQTIKDAVANGDWRAAAKALELLFPEYRQNSKVEVSATANASTPFIVLTPERTAELQERRKRLLEGM